MITYNNTDRHTVQAHVAKFHWFWLKMDLLCMDLLCPNAMRMKRTNAHFYSKVHSRQFAVCLFFFFGGYNSIINY